MNTDMNPEDYKQVFHSGNGRSVITIEDIETDAWQMLVDYLNKTDAELQYSMDGEPIAEPKAIRNIFDFGDHKPLLTVLVAGIAVHCQLDNPGRMEFELDSKDIDDDLKARVIFRLMSTIGRQLDRRVVLASEAAAGQPQLIYEPGPYAKHKVSGTQG